MLGPFLMTAAVFCLLSAVAPRPMGARARRRGLDLIRASTVDAPATGSPARSVPLLALRALTARLGVRGTWVRREELIEAGIDPEVLSPAEVVTLKLLLGAGGLALAIVLSAAVPGLLLLAPAGAWLGFILPSLCLGQLRARRRGRVLAELPDIVGLLRAFLGAQVPLEQALHLISAQLAEGDPGNVLAAELRLALGDYGLGRTIEESLTRMAERVGVEELKTVVGAIAQGKRLGSGMETILRDQELLARMAQRNRATAAASQVSTRLMAVLVGVYLPEFVVLVMIPLFWGVMLRAFG